MLVGSYTVQVEVSTHSVEEFEYEAIAHLDVDISPALPYLNATLSRGLYQPTRPALSWRHEGRNVGFWPDRIAVDHLDSREQAQEIIGRLVELINDVWEKREQIEPDTRTREWLQPLDVYRLLPCTNCRMCGESTCFNFALKLVTGQMALEQCEPLYKSAQYEGKRAQLESLVDQAPA